MVKNEKISKIKLMNFSAELFLSRFKKNNIPSKLQLVVTNKCNLRCTNCSIWEIYPKNPDKLKEEMELKDYEKLFRGFRGKLKWLAVTGGEPSLRGDIVDIVKHAKLYNPDLFFVSLNTNGLLPDKIKKVVLELRKFVPHLKVIISLDGDKKTHTKLRGVDISFKQLMKTYYLLKEINVDVEFEHTVHAENASNTKELFTNFKHADDIKVITFTNISDNYFSNGTNVMADKLEENKGKIMKSLAFVYKKYKINSIESIVIKLHLKFSNYFLKFNKMPVTCSAGLNVLTVDPYGNVSPCLFINSKQNIKEEKTTLPNILKSNFWKTQNKLIKKDKCPKCWMNCYSLTSMVTYPERTLWRFLTFRK